MSTPERSSTARDAAPTPKASPPPSLQVTIEEIPHGGARLRGESNPSWLDIHGADIQADGQVSHDLRVTLDRDSLHIDGIVEAPFLLECVRCLELFPYRVNLTGYHATIPAENGPIIDLTERIREDILLALPGYPKCEQAFPQGEPCTVSNDFEGDRALSTGPSGDGDQDDNRPANRVWDVLDDLATGDEST